MRIPMKNITQPVAMVPMLGRPEMAGFSGDWAGIFSQQPFARIGVGKRGGLHDKNEAVWFCSNSDDFAFDVSAGGANSSIFGFTPRDNYNAACPPLTLLAAGRHLAVRNAAAQTN
jgi:hypothetical protein